MRITTAIKNSNVTVKATSHTNTLGKVIEVRSKHPKATQKQTTHKPTTVNRGFASKNKTLLAAAVIKESFRLGGFDSELVSLVSVYEGNSDNTVRYLKVTFNGVTFDVTTASQAFSAVETYKRELDRATRAEKQAQEKRERELSKAKKALDSLLALGLLTSEEYRAKCATLNA